MWSPATIDLGPGGTLTPKSPPTVAAGLLPFWLTIGPSARVPTSKDQYKNGGWRNFPGYKNEGDCVSWVQTGGKKPPGGL